MADAEPDDLEAQRGDGTDAVSGVHHGSDGGLFQVRLFQNFFSNSNDLNLLFRDINFNDGWEMRKDSLPYAMNFSAPGVEIYCLYGTGIDTVEK